MISLERTLASAAVLVAAGLTSTAALAAGASGQANIEVLMPLSVTVDAPITFGSVVGSGSVDMLPDGQIQCNYFDACAGTRAPGQFTVTGTPNSRVLISMPTGNFDLTDGNGHTMTVGNIAFGGNNVSIQSYFYSHGWIDTSGSLTFKMYASLWVSPGTPPGNYSGDYSVVVDNE